VLATFGVGSRSFSGLSEVCFGACINMRLHRLSRWSLAAFSQMAYAQNEKLPAQWPVRAAGKWRETAQILKLEIPLWTGWVPLQDTREESFQCFSVFFHYRSLHGQ